jgi:hypothetical protein
VCAADNQRVVNLSHQLLHGERFLDYGETVKVSAAVTIAQLLSANPDIFLINMHVPDRGSCWLYAHNFIVPHLSVVVDLTPKSTFGAAPTSIETMQIIRAFARDVALQSKIPEWRAGAEQVLWRHLQEGPLLIPCRQEQAARAAAAGAGAGASASAGAGASPSAGAGASPSAGAGVGADARAGAGVGSELAVLSQQPGFSTGGPPWTPTKATRAASPDRH